MGKLRLVGTCFSLNEIRKDAYLVICFFLLVFLLFVQGANTMLFSLGKRGEDRRLIMGATGRKWEVTFTTLVTFGGAFFASFPLFYSTSFGGAYWLWMIILFSFVLQAVSYEFQNKLGNILGTRTFQWLAIIHTCPCRQPTLRTSRVV